MKIFSFYCSNFIEIRNKQLFQRKKGDISLSFLLIRWRLFRFSLIRPLMIFLKQWFVYLSFWKDADPGIADVEDAKKSLAGLKKE